MYDKKREVGRKKVIHGLMLIDINNSYLFGHFLALCPGFLQSPQRHLAGGLAVGDEGPGTHSLVIQDLELQSEKLVLEQQVEDMIFFCQDLGRNDVFAYTNTTLSQLIILLGKSPGVT